MFAGAQQVAIPYRNHGPGLARLQGRIALFEDLLITLPVSHEGLLHVEHTPIQETPAAARAFLNEAMHLGIDNLNRQEQCQLGQGGGLIPVDLRADPLSRTFDSHGHAPVRRTPRAEDNESFGPMATEMLQTPRAKGAAAAQDINGLEQAGLARRVGSRN